MSTSICQPVGLRARAGSFVTSPRGRGGGFCVLMLLGGAGAGAGAGVGNGKFNPGRSGKWMGHMRTLNFGGTVACRYFDSFEVQGKWLVVRY